MENLKRATIHMYQNKASKSRKGNNNFIKGLALVSIGPTVIVNFLPQIKAGFPVLPKALQVASVDEASILIITSLLLGVLAVIIGGMIRRRDSADKQKGTYGPAVGTFYLFFAFMLVAYFFLDPGNFFDDTDFNILLYINGILSLTYIANIILISSYVLNVHMANKAREKLRESGWAFLANLTANVAIVGDGFAFANRVLVNSSSYALPPDISTIVLTSNIILSVAFLLTNWISTEAVEDH